MPTLASLLERELISRIEVALERDVSPLRLLYGTEAFLEWVARAPSFQRGVGDWPDQTPAEQLDWLFYRFTSGMPMIPLRDFRVLRHEARPARELKTPDLRVFGWLAKRDCFIAAFGDWADKVRKGRRSPFSPPRGLAWRLGSF